MGGRVRKSAYIQCVLFLLMLVYSIVTGIYESAIAWFFAFFWAVYAGKRLDEIERMRFDCRLCRSLSQ